MNKTSITYICPNAANCTLHKRCHVLTTDSELTQEIAVWQKCIAAGKDIDGKTKEILISIGKAV